MNQSPASLSTQSTIKLLFVFSLGLAVSSCSPDKKQVNFPSDPLIVGKGTPIQLEPETTQIIVEDFVPSWEKIDSITSPGIRLDQKGNKLYAIGNLNTPLSVLHFWSQGVSESVLLKKSNKRKVELVFSGEATDVRSKGEFNAWNQNNTVFAQQDGQFKTSLELNPGSYQYLFVVDGKEIRDPNNPDSVSNGMGGWNSILNLERPSKSELPMLQGVSISDSEVKLESSNPPDEVYALLNNTYLPKSHWSLIEKNISISLPENAPEGRSILRVFAANSMGMSNEMIIPLQDGSPITDPKLLSRHDREAMVMYFLMVDRFNNGNPENDKPLNIPEVHPKADYYGGDISGITNKITDGYFDDLGTNTIWISPITQNPEGAYGKYPEPETSFSAYHGYWPISNVNVDYRFGTDDEFQDMVDQAHDSEFNVLLDYVANHVHEEHPIYQNNKDWATSLYLPDGTENTQKWDEHRLTTWFDTFMPTLDLSRPEIVEPMTDSAMFWLTEYGIDGFRHDATKHIPLIFWRELTKKVKAQSNGQIAFQIGETYGSRELINSYINTGMLDSQFDFNMYDAAVSAFAKPEESFDYLVSSLNESLSYYGDHHLMGNITGNQDRPRFISYADGSLRFDEDTKHAGWNREIVMSDTSAYRKLSALTAYMMTIPGIPCIYYGDEYGSVGGNDPDNRKMMKFDGLSEHEIATRDRAKKMIELRRNNLALIYGSTKVLLTTKNTLAIERTYFNNRVVSIFNKSAEPKTFDLRGEKGTSNFYAEITGSTATLPGNSFDMITFNNP